MSDSSNSLKWGTISGTSAYLLWGVLPIYWKWLDHIPSVEILAHRILWSLLFMTVLLIVIGKGQHFIKECKGLLKQPKLLVGMILASLLISLNWYTYIWAVTNDRVVEASLGYYINPLVSVLLGVFFLKERLLRLQWISVLLAAIAVILLTISLGTFPYVAFCLAISFGLYGLIKKVVQVGSLSGVAIETMIVIPFALSYLIIQHGFTTKIFYVNDGMTFGLLAGAGVATAIPLLLFATGAKRISLTLLGFLQYIAPTMMLLLGIFVYQESFTPTHLIAFVIIWIASLLFTVSRLHNFRKSLKKQFIVVTEVPEALSKIK